VRDVRAAIFGLHSTRLPGRSVRQEVIDLCTESARGLGFDPMVRFDGPIDTAVDDTLADDLFAVLREALTNVARHAHAGSVEVSVAVRDTTLRVTVDDDGVGPVERALMGSGGDGVGNMRSRASRLHGDFSIGARQPGGTSVKWMVPLKLER
jgi:signal transduction histidine kinase